jgi:hypothetical protein
MYNSTEALVPSMNSGQSVVPRWCAEVVEAAVEVGVGRVRLCELVFKNDDAACRVECGAVVDEFADPGGDAKLVSGVAAMAAAGALRCE